MQHKLSRDEAGNTPQTLSKLAVALWFGDQKQPQALAGRMFDWWVPSQFFFTVADNLLGDKTS